MNANQPPDQKDWKYYLDRIFLWDMHTAEILYRFSYRSFKRNMYHKYFKTHNDFEDVFHYAMLIFCEKVEGHIYSFETNRKAYNALWTIFRNAAVDFVRNGNVIIHDIEKTDPNLLGQEGAMDLVPHTDREKILVLFDKMDKNIKSDPRIMSKRQTEFYHNYKTAIIGYMEEKEIRSFVMQKMNIDIRYFGKLKTQVIDIIRRNQ